MTDKKGRNMPEYAWLELKAWGEYACFTRPEMKAERVSYSVMTPSAARGLLEAIFWKPEISWQIREIWVLNPIRHFSILRNEANNKATAATARWPQSGQVAPRSGTAPSEGRP